MPDRQREPSPNALALYRFLQEEWDAMGVRPTAWCRRHGMSDATVLRWREGVEPDMALLKRVATELNRPLYEVLLAAGYITSDDLNGKTVTERTYSVPEALRGDPKLKDVPSGKKELLRQLYDQYVVDAQQVRRPSRSRRALAAAQ